ncbi:hypothetical protein ABBQ32_006532 [Trebouxia sp. C0010 RCD-2024]
MQCNTVLKAQRCACRHIHQVQRPRHSLSVHAAKGFGPPPQQQPAPSSKREQGNNKSNNTRKTSEQVAQSIAQKVSRKTPSASKGVRPVDKSQASKGKLDYVKVKNWGSGEPADLGELQVESFSQELVSDHSKRFYEQLARRLEELQSRGLLNIVQPENSKPLPPFEKWSLTEKRYIQYMCDQQNVHYAMEAAVAEAVATGPAGPHKSSELQPSKACAAAFEAVACFGESAGLDRSLQIASDLDNLAKASSITNRSFEVNPTQQAVACCEYIARLGAIAGEEQEEEYRQEAVLRLITMAYGLHVAHLTTGMRIGSAAAEKLNLFQSDALHFYRTYPDAQDPLKRFMQTVNSAGSLLTAEQQEQVMEELPRAFPKISLLLTTLAHID